MRFDAVPDAVHAKPPAQEWLQWNNRRGTN